MKNEIIHEVLEYNDEKYKVIKKEIKDINNKISEIEIIIRNDS